MKPTRKTQPHKRGDREPSPVLEAMLAGRPTYGANPADFQRASAQRSALAALLATRPVDRMLSTVRDEGRASPPNNPNDKRWIRKPRPRRARSLREMQKDGWIA